MKTVFKIKLISKKISNSKKENIETLFENLGFNCMESNKNLKLTSMELETKIALFP